MIAAHSIRKTPSRFRQSSAHLGGILVALLGVGVAGAGGCRAPGLHELTGGDIEVRLDSNAKAHMPGRQIKFFVDLVNQSGADIDVTGVRIELRASPRGSPETISLRHTWRYLWRIDSPPLHPGKRMTIPVVPEQGVEFPLEILAAGDYEIVAVVNERFTSGPYPLAIVRPDLGAGRAESTIPGAHRRFDAETRSPLLGSGDRWQLRGGERGERS